MRKFMIAAVLASSMSLGACATDRYGENDRQLQRAGTGAAIGAAAGAAAGAIIGGVSPVEGAVAGAVVGGAVGAITNNNRRYYTDQYGRCYYLNKYDQRVYDNRGCGSVRERY